MQSNCLHSSFIPFKRRIPKKRCIVEKAKGFADKNSVSAEIALCLAPIISPPVPSPAIVGLAGFSNVRITLFGHQQRVA